MNTDTRDAIADLALLGVAAAAVYVVARTPPLRRATWQLLKYGLFTAAPTYLWQETVRAWAASDPRAGMRNSVPGRKADIIDV